LWVRFPGYAAVRLEALAVYLHRGRGKVQLNLRGGLLALRAPAIVTKLQGNQGRVVEGVALGCAALAVEVEYPAADATEIIQLELWPYFPARRLTSKRHFE
jgi:hypothetical protein